MKYVPLFDALLDSTLWEENLEVRTLYFTMLLLMEPDYVVRLDFEKIAKKARLRPGRRENFEEAQKALKVLMEPDRLTMADQSDDGIRVKRVEGGYFVVSGEKYQDLMIAVNRARKRIKAQRDRRAAERALKQGRRAPGEAAYLKASENGENAVSDRIIEESLPGGGVEQAAARVRVLPPEPPEYSPVEVEEEAEQRALEADIPEAGGLDDEPPLED